MLILFIKIVTGAILASTNPIIALFVTGSIYHFSFFHPRRRGSIYKRLYSITNRLTAYHYFTN